MNTTRCFDPRMDEVALSAPKQSTAPSYSRLALKHGGHFLVLAEDGLMPEKPGAGYGLYFADTRYLNRWELVLNGAPLRLLRSATSDAFAAEFVYGDQLTPDAHGQTVSIRRDIVINDERVHERITLTNFGSSRQEFAFDILHAADFVDMFEVRGSKREKRGEHLGASVSDDRQSLTFAYRGLDNRQMQTRIQYTTLTPDALVECGARFSLNLAPAQKAVIEIVITTELEGEEYCKCCQPETFDQAFKAAHQSYADWRASGATITTSDPRLNSVLERAYRDIYMLRQPTPKGTCLAAGVPWYAVAFGRDQCVTALQTLPLFPDLTREVISVLAAYQGTKDDAWTEQLIGSIMHELRLGEMARVKEVPFVPYYGTVDATPLWLTLLCRYVEWTGDVKFARKLWRNVKLGLHHLKRSTTTGYLAYGTRPPLSNKGWKDSGDSIMHEDGVLATGPIALCEAQGYLYSAWTGVSELALKLGYVRQSRTLARKAALLKKRFNRDFWMADERYIALALDGHNQQCKVIASNAGHLLETGLLEPETANAVALRLGQPDMFCGWGIRTLASSEARYNPMSYHNGSVWPHDNSLIVSGLCLTGHQQLAHDVLTGMFDAARSENDLRLPELFSGFPRQANDLIPVHYPVSCVPQAWAAGTLFLMLTSCLGLRGNAIRQELTISKPTLPAWLSSVTVTGLRVGASVVDVHFERTPKGLLGVSVAKKLGDTAIKIDC